MKKELSRLERVIVHVLVSPKLRPVEDEAAVALAKSVAARAGISAAALAVVLELIQHFLA